MNIDTVRSIQTSIPLALFAGIAVAQPPPPPPAAEERMIERRVEVRVENGGPPEVVINGQRVAPDRIRPRGDGSFEIIGGPGETIVEVIEVPRGPQQRMQAP
ncbi:MAG: hypothetical protein ACO4BU_03640, partial [Phycisphaerales bacterium]